MKLVEILKRNRELALTLPGDKYRVAVISNVTVNQFKEILEFTLRTDGLKAEVIIGDFDAIVQDSARFAESNAVLVFWEAGNLIDGFHNNAELFSEGNLDELARQVEGAMDLVLRNLNHTPLVLLNRFSSALFNSNPLQEGALQKMCRRLNLALESKVEANQIVVDLDAVLAEVGLSTAADMRQFISAKTLYSVEFFRAYAEVVKPAFMAVTGRAKKILVLDCDNTLWGGILGEDGTEGIHLSDATPQGKAYREAQAVFRSLRNEGVLLALCSKNNPSDVEKLLREHPDMVVKEHDLVAQKVNWQDKATNLREIAAELNIGLDSFILVDDSSFEIGLIQKELPQVTCVQVPQNLSEYPARMRELRRAFFSLSRTDEDQRKTEMYRQEKLRKEEASVYTSTEDYLATLKLKLTFTWSPHIPVARAAQMSQKTNQFNLTTRRYSEGDIQRMLDDSFYKLATFSVADRHGDYGVSGMIIIQQDRNDPRRAVIDSLLMSCRVIGRNVERVFFDELIRILPSMGIVHLRGEYLPTTKNSQVQQFYPALGFELITQTEKRCEYQLALTNYRPSGIQYIEKHQLSI